MSKNSEDLHYSSGSNFARYTNMGLAIFQRASAIVNGSFESVIGTLAVPLFLTQTFTAQTPEQARDYLLAMSFCSLLLADGVHTLRSSERPLNLIFNGIESLCKKVGFEGETLPKYSTLMREAEMYNSKAGTRDL